MASPKAEPSKTDVDHVESPPALDEDHPQAADDAGSQSWEPFDDDFNDPTPRSSDDDADVDADGDGDWVQDHNNPEEMSRWAGQPSIKGSSDAMRMILLNFCTLGIT
jgi:hypothetical protein